MKFLLLFILLPFFAFAESGVTNNLKIAGNLQTSKNIVNGSFESGANTGWTISAGTLTATTAQEVQGAQSGLWSITGAGTIDLCATPTNLANSDLVASGWVKSTSTDLQVCSVINSVENGCTAIGSVTGWKKVQATGTYSTGNFCFRLKSVASGAITAYVDDVKIEPLEFPSAATITQSWQDGTEWTNFTPTLGGFSVQPTINLCRWKREKSDLLVDCRTSGGTTSASTLTLPYPTGLTADNTTGRIAGVASSEASGYQDLLALPTSSAFTFVRSSTGIGDTSTTGANINGGSLRFGIQARVAISGWSSAPTLLALPVSKDNVFSARMNNDGTVSSKSSDWIASSTKSSTGTYVITFKSSIFTASPAAVVSTNQGNQYWAVASTSPTTVTIKTFLDNGALTDQGFDITITKVAPDYTPAGVFISNINPDGFNKTTGQVGLVESFSFSYGTTNATTVCSANPCSYLDQIGSIVTSITRNSTGSYTANLTKTFTKLKCSIQSSATGSGEVLSGGQCASCNSINFGSVASTTGSSADSRGTVLCQGY